MQKKPQNTAVQSLERLGFNQGERMEQFLALPAHEALLAKFEVVFPQSARPKFGSLPLADTSLEEVDIMGSPDDKELDLSGGDELSLSDDGDFSPTLPVDEGLDLGGDEDGLTLTDESAGPEELDALAGMDDLGGLGGLDGLGDDDDAHSPPPIDATMTGLRLGDDLDALDDDVQAKMKEIDEIMEYDATQVKEGFNASDLDDEGDLDNLFGGTSSEDLVSASAEDGVLEEKSLVFDASDDLGFAPMEEDVIDTPKPAAKAAPAVVEASAPEDDMMAELSPIAEEEMSFSAEVAPEAPVAAKAAPVASAPARPQARPAGQEEYREVVGHYNAELERLQATLNHLRTDRESLLKKLDAQEEEKIHHQRQMLNLRAELDEKKIEMQLMKKRMSDDTQDLRYNLQLEQERRHIADEKLKAQQAEMAAVQQKIRMEVRKVSGHERELEQQLELLKSDAETQIRNRDLKILELKRRLDAMEFDVENMSALEKKSQENKQELEVKLDKAIRTLRAAIGILEVDDPKVAGLEKLKKSLDV